MRELIKSLAVVKITKKQLDRPPIKGSSIAVQCDNCSKMWQDGDRFKCAECADFDYCEDCFNKYELNTDSHGQEHASHVNQQHPFWVVR